MNLLRCCRESVDSKITSMDWKVVKKLLVRQKLSQWIENLLRSYQDKFQIARWIEIAIRSVEKRSSRGSIDRKLSRICQEAVELDKKQFFKERKNIQKWMQTSKLLKQRSKQHFKLSEKISQQEKCKAFMIQNTHTHQTSLTNFIFKKQVKTV